MRIFRTTAYLLEKNQNKTNNNNEI